MCALDPVLARTAWCIARVASSPQHTLDSFPSERGVCGGPLAFHPETGCHILYLVVTGRATSPYQVLSLTEL
jgi:hypothetical protein